MYVNTPLWKDFDLNGIGYFTKIHINRDYGCNVPANTENGVITPGISPEYALLSKSYAVGGTGIRENEDIDNSKYYYEFIKYLMQSGNLLDSISTICGGNAF